MFFLLAVLQIGRLSGWVGHFWGLFTFMAFWADVYLRFNLDTWIPSQSVSHQPPPYAVCHIPYIPRLRHADGCHFLQRCDLRLWKVQRVEAEHSVFWWMEANGTGVWWRNHTKSHVESLGLGHSLAQVLKSSSCVTWFQVLTRMHFHSIMWRKGTQSSVDW